MHKARPLVRARSRPRRPVLGAVLAAVLASAGTMGTALPPDGPEPPMPSTPAAPYALLHVDERGHVARWNPCTTIRVRVNHADPRAPADADSLVTVALTRLEVASGLRFEVVGPTTFMPYAGTGLRQPDADLVVAWTDAATVPALAGDVAGQGGAMWTTTEAASRIWHAHLVLDVEDPLEPGFTTGRSVGAALLHELGHTVGLAHVDDPRRSCRRAWETCRCPRSRRVTSPVCDGSVRRPAASDAPATGPGASPVPRPSPGAGSGSSDNTGGVLRAPGRQVPARTCESPGRTAWTFDQHRIRAAHSS